jgi:hypothetical protein
MLAITVIQISTNSYDPRRELGATLFPGLITATSI